MNIRSHRCCRFDRSELNIAVVRDRVAFSPMKLAFRRSQEFRPVAHRGVVGRISAFQPDGPAGIPGGIRNFNFYPGTQGLSFVYVLFSVVSGDDPDIVLTIY